MRTRWDAFAAEDAMYYAETSRRDWSADEFYASGGEVVESMRRWAGPSLGSGRALDLGCGPGRMSMHLARYFSRVDAVDISAGMIERARAAGLPENVHLYVLEQARLPFEDGSFDFVLSFTVFQHIPDREVTASYLTETARMLAPEGRAVLHFDTRPGSALRGLALRLPDPLLPRRLRRFVRRYPVPASTLHQALSERGLGIVEERGVDTAEHLLLLSPQGASVSATQRPPARR